MSKAFEDRLRKEVGVFLKEFLRYEKANARLRADLEIGRSGGATSVVQGRPEPEGMDGGGGVSRRRRKKLRALGETSLGRAEEKSEESGYRLVLSKNARLVLQKLQDDGDLENFNRIMSKLSLLASNPKHPSFNNHSGNSRTQKLKMVFGDNPPFIAYVNKGSNAWRIVWGYGSDYRTIEVINIVSHNKY